MKIEIKNRWSGELIFSVETDNWKLAVEAAIKANADLSYANLSFADLSSADLRFANLRFANLRFANLSSTDLSSADLSYANLRFANLSSTDLSSADLRFANLSSTDLSYANLSFADLSSADLRFANLRFAKNLPEWYINLCSRDMLFVFQHLKAELPYLRDKLVKGQVDGTQYEGDCACLIGTLGKADGGVDKVCTMIPYYDKGLHNYGEMWFFQIKQGDTPKNNQFAKHALLLLDSVLKPKGKKK